ncbi:MAG: triose-phosphate isomerase [Candidatus Obscuribacterales bacterium]|nr:triose-phosphate isomerase [Candidatus Obscuribacterales bacterium]
MRKTIIAGNWKMHKNQAESKALITAVLEGVSQMKGETLPDIVLCPVFLSLPLAAETLKSLKEKHGEVLNTCYVGAQNMDYHESGAFTGEIAPGMLTDIGLTHVIIGHSERRQYFAETNASVNLKTRAALANKLVPIVCVGETLDEREAGLTDQVIRRQVASALEELDKDQVAKIVVAYEPVWAIGTGKNCESTEANRVCKMIRETINELYATNVADAIPVLYGGSVKPSTIVEQMEQSDIDGALVGGASLKAEDFLPIIKGGAGRSKLMGTRA